MSATAPEGVDGEIEGCAAVAEACSEETRDRRPFEEFLAEGTGRGTPIDFSAFRFRREDIEGLPECPGVYRFLDDRDEVLYVGKARNLRQRLAQYFLPLSPDSRRREAFLGSVRDLAWTPLDSELAALIQESSEIRDRHPRWNVQMKIHREEGPQDLGSTVFAIPSALVPGAHEVYLFHREAAARLVGLLGGPGSAEAMAPESLASALRRFFGGGEPEGEPVVNVLHPEEATLVRRWYRTHRDELLRMNLDHFATWQSAAESLITAVAGRATGASLIRDSAGESRS
jgi:hypothetical protein